MKIKSHISPGMMAIPVVFSLIFLSWSWESPQKQKADSKSQMVTAKITPDNALPAIKVQEISIYSRDYEGDNGTEPSDYRHNIWYHGPDLWNRLSEDGNTIHADPEFGQINFVYGRIHNIGSTTQNNVTIDFSWCIQSAWADIGSWIPISTVFVNGFLSNESRVINTPWEPPAPGMYCLHTVLNVPGDLANADGRSYMDNNKVQINVSVVNNVPGWSIVYPFLIENGSNKESNVDILIQKLNIQARRSKIKIEIPLGISFEEVIGAKVTQSGTLTIINLDNCKKEALLKQTILRPNEKKMAFIIVTTPKIGAIKNTASIKLSEMMNKNEMGGIIFNAKGADPVLVFTKQVEKLSNLFKMLSRKFKVQSAERIIEFIHYDLGKIIISDQFMLSLRRLVELEHGTFFEMSKLMTQKDYDQYQSSIEQTMKGIEQKNLSLIRESQDRLIYSTIPLFVKNFKIIL